MTTVHIPETHFSRCSTRCNVEAGIHYALVETVVPDIDTMKFRHLGDGVTLLEDQDHVLPGTCGTVVEIHPAIEHGLPHDPDWPYVWLVGFLVDL